MGITDDNQLASISSNEQKLKLRNDSSNTTKGLEPFIFSFTNDTLSLFFNKEQNYVIKDTFKTVFINYKILDAKEFSNLRVKVNQENSIYKIVPIKKEILLPNDMPKPSKNTN